MQGTITRLKKYRGGHFFILGDDGVEYFSHRNYVENAKGKELWFEGFWLSPWDVYGYEGNRVNFETESEQIGDRPIAVNVVLEETLDPHLSEKLLVKTEHSENREKHAKNKEKNLQRLLQKQLEAKRKCYVIQEYVSGAWETVYRDDTVLSSPTIEVGKALIEDLKRQSCGNAKYRLKTGVVYKDYASGRTIIKMIK